MTDGSDPLMTKQQVWLLGIVQAVGTGEENQAEVVFRCFDMVEDLGADLKPEDARAVLRHVVRGDGVAEGDVENFIQEMDALGRTLGGWE